MRLVQLFHAGTELCDLAPELRHLGAVALHNDCELGIKLLLQAGNFGVELPLEPGNCLLHLVGCRSQSVLRLWFQVRLQNWLQLVSKVIRWLLLSRRVCWLQPGWRPAFCQGKHFWRDTLASLQEMPGVQSYNVHLIRFSCCTR